MPENPSEDNCDQELYKLPLDKKIKFSIKSHLTDATFIIEGRKIYAGSDFLSIHSPFFNALLKGEYFAESQKKEIELKDVAYLDFLELLRFLYDPSRPIKEGNVMRLLMLADRYDIKFISDRIEDALVAEGLVSDPVMLLISDRLQLIRAQAWFHVDLDMLGGEEEEAARDEMEWSAEFEIVSAAARNAYYAAANKTVFPSHRNRNLSPGSSCAALCEVERVEEPMDGFIATGVLGYRHYDDHNRPHIDLAGLIWNLRDSEEVDVNGEDSLSPLLMVNLGYPSTVEWAVEGFVEVELSKVSRSSGLELGRVAKKYAFSLNNSVRVGRLENLATVKDFPHSNDFVHFSNVRISIAAVSGVRKSPKYDFTVPSQLTDAAFIVEGRKIHVNKQYLSSISTSLRRMLHKSNEVELQNVKYEEFIEFINWLYPSSRKNLSVSTMFDVLMVAEKCGVMSDMDTSVMYNYFNDSHPFYSYFFAEKMIFCFQFDIWDMKDTRNPVWCNNRKKIWSAGFNLLKNCDLLTKMTPEKKIAMYEWMMSKEYM